MQTTFVLVSATIGAMIAFQALVNTRLATYTGSIIWTAVVSFLVGFLGLLAIAVAMRSPFPTLNMVSEAPWWAWIGGLLGATYIAAVIVLVPRMSPAVLFGSAIAGQMLMLVIAEHFALAGVTRHPVNVTRIAGVVLIVAGTALCKR
jgi:bacterial/archaeal transporter family-2 protein